MEHDFGSMAALIGDPVRARILWTLFGGRAHTATELAVSVGTSPQNLSMHLAKLVRADLLSVEAQGRHRYYSFARPEVAYAVESLAGLLPGKPGIAGAADEKEDQPIRVCRTCYDHLAGRIGVQLTGSLTGKGLIRLGEAETDQQRRSGGISGKSFIVTVKGNRFFGGLGIDCEALRVQRRGLARACLDWTERRPHLAGSLGAALLEVMLDRHWLRRMAGTRAVLVTAKGRKAMQELFGLAL